MAKRIRLLRKEGELSLTYNGRNRSFFAIRPESLLNFIFISVYTSQVVIIGSGATAVTLLPSMTPTASHVTMLQRSPSYFITLPRGDPLSDLLKFILPASIAHSIIRFIMTLRSYVFLWLCRLFPSGSRSVLRWMVSKQLPKDVPLDPHFKPSYKPWDQRVW